MKRLVPIAALAALLISLLIAPARGLADTRGSDSTFQRFQARVCQISSKQKSAAAPYILRFDDYYYNYERTPANLEAAGAYLQRLYVIYAKDARRAARLHDPSEATLWRKYGRQERRVLKLGFQAARALLEANNGLYRKYNARNVSWQRKRNATWNRLRIYCD
jgi:hypothetical protein